MATIRDVASQIVVMDDRGNRMTLLKITPVVSDTTSDGPYTYERRSSITAPNGQDVIVNSDTEFEIDGRRWTLVEQG